MKSITKKVSAGTRVYYLDVLQDKNNQRYVALSEIPTDAAPNGSKKRHRIFVYEKRLEAFRDALTELIEELNVSKR